MMYVFTIDQINEMLKNLENGNIQVVKDELCSPADSIPGTLDEILDANKDVLMRLKYS